MRAVAVLAAALLLTGCSWVQKELPWSAPSPPPAAPASALAVPPKPTEPAPHPPRPKPRVERPASAPAAPPAKQTQSEPQAVPAVDYEARCRAMAANRAGDARELGASAADQAKVQSDTYRDCLVQSK